MASLHILDQLDMGLNFDDERVEHIKGLLNDDVVHRIEQAEGKDASFNAQLNAAADYILYGRELDSGKNQQEQKRVIIDKPRRTFISYESLDDATKERVVPLSQKNRTVCPKPKIVRPEYDKSGNCINEGLHDGKITGMTQIWDSIDRLEALKAKTEPGSLEEYQYKKWIIALRTEQFDLKRMGKQPMSRAVASSYTHAPIEDDITDKIDLSNPYHIGKIIDNYMALSFECENNILSPIRYLLWEINELIRIACLCPQHKFVLDCRIKRLPVTTIANLVQKKFGLMCKRDYVSTMFYAHICKRISAAVTIREEELKLADKPEAWKICNQCGRSLLKHPHYFTRKSSNPDGFVNKCKECSRDARKKSL